MSCFREIACIGISVICLFATFPTDHLSETDSILIRCDESGLEVNVPLSVLNRDDTVELLVQSVPTGEILLKSSRRFYHDSAKSMGYEMKLADLLENVPAQDSYIRISIYSERSSDPAFGFKIIEERLYRVRDLMKLRSP